KTTLRSPLEGFVADRAVERVRPMIHVQHVGAHAVFAVARDALGARPRILIVGVAVAARRGEVAPAQRELAAIVIEADDRPAIGAVALLAREQRAAAVRIAVAALAIGVELGAAARVVAGGAAHRLVPPLEREIGVPVL